MTPARAVSLLRCLDAPALPDRHGLLVNPCHRTMVSQEWHPPLRTVVMWCRRHFGARLAAVYLRGSVARATAVPYVSDLDITVVMEGDLHTQDAEACGARASLVARRYPVCASVEIVPLSRRSLRRAPECAGARFLLKTFGICIDGRDVTRRMKSFAMRDVPALCLPGLPASMSEAARILQSRPSPAVARRICRWAAKQLVRSAYELALPELVVYSRDIVHCATIASQRLPRAESLIWRAAKYVVEPTDDASSVLDLIGTLSPIITRASARSPRAVPPHPAVRRRLFRAGGKVF